ncbi:MAG: Lipopolysaccharide core heptosyltransferase RfaQ [Chlamydiia bacterium]|nr:Lipopolysaccharide core heptosyltransferase RfaQ [Chlamydiia bacterium]MCH9616683.1 Lipopolysaccharide core heptosyltransferase RfaQ [Chlamydiia bacterium]MCH9629414.1 Lipopolysaccharide core heptosyltransferase RfaQ [Chlamydiia bacterium]
MSDPKKILVAKLRHHGDVLLSTPVFTALKRAYPNAKITAYINQETLPMLEGHPAISDFLLYDRKKKTPLREMARLWRIKRAGFDLVLNLTEGDRGALAARVSGAKVRVGWDPQGGGMKGKKKMYTHIIKHCPHPRHTVEKNLDAVRALGIFPTETERSLFFNVPDDAYPAIEGNYALIHPVSRWMFKCLPTKVVAEVMEHLAKKYDKLVITASPDPAEIAMVTEILSHIPDVPVVNLAGKLSLKELGGLIEKAAFLFTVDSVPLHLASWSKTPVAVVFGPTSEKNWGPWQHPHATVITKNIECRPCYHPGCGGSGVADCLETLSATDIIHQLTD